MSPDQLIPFSDAELDTLDYAIRSGLKDAHADAACSTTAAAHEIAARRLHQLTVLRDHVDRVIYERGAADRLRAVMGEPVAARP